MSSLLGFQKLCQWASCRPSPKFGFFCRHYQVLLFVSQRRAILHLSYCLPINSTILFPSRNGEINRFCLFPLVDLRDIDIFCSSFLLKLYCSGCSLIHEHSNTSKKLWTLFVLFKAITLTLNTLGSLFSRRHFQIYFLFFSRKQDLTFHANCLHWRQFAWNVKSCFIGKITELSAPA